MSSREGSIRNSGCGARWDGFTLSWMGENAHYTGSLPIRMPLKGSRSSNGSAAMDTEISRQPLWRSQPVQGHLRSQHARVEQHCKLPSQVMHQRRAAEPNAFSTSMIDHC